MICPRCGYVMDDFQDDCPRCKRFGSSSEAPSTTAPTSFRPVRPVPLQIPSQNPMPTNNLPPSITPVQLPPLPSAAPPSVIERIPDQQYPSQFIPPSVNSGDYVQQGYPPAPPFPQAPYDGAQGRPYSYEQPSMQSVPSPFIPGSMSSAQSTYQNASTQKRSKVPTLWIVLSVITVVVIIICSAYSHVNKTYSDANKTFLNDVSGVWMEPNGSRIVLDFRGDNPIITLSSKSVEVIIEEVDLNQQSMIITVGLKGGGTGKWTFSKVMQEDNKFHLRLTNHIGEQEELSFIQDL